MTHAHHAHRMQALHLSPALHFQTHRPHHRPRCLNATPAFNDVATQQHPLSPPPPPSLATPLVDAVAQRGNRANEAPFHVPGHKRGSNPPPALARLALPPAMRFDLTELDGLDNLAAPGGPIAAAQALAAQAWGAGTSHLLVNGTSVGIQAAVLALCSSAASSPSKESAALVLGRNAHQSAFNAAALAGCAVEYAAAVQAHGMAHHVTPDALDAAFHRAKTRGLRPAAALVVSPTYFGVVSDVAGLVAVCRRHGALLIVDEAHGAHLRFVSTGVAQKWLSDVISTSSASSKFLAPSDALQGGADVVIQSTHKQLGALTQGAMLHLNQAAAAAEGSRIARALRTLQTSSPSYLIMASLDAARAQAQDPQAVATPHAAAAHIHAWFAAAKKEISTVACSSSSSASLHLGLKLLGQDMLLHEAGGGRTTAARAAHAAPAGIDPWRFTVILEGLPAGVTAWDAAAALERARGVVAELATRDAMVFAVGMGTTTAHASQLTAAFEWLADSHAGWAAQLAATEANSATGSGTPFIVRKKDTEREAEFSVEENVDGCCWPEAVLSPRQALTAPAEAVPWKAAIGRVSAELLSPYPPGVPAVCPGERFETAVVERLRAVLAAGGKVVGAEDGTLQTLRVAILSEEE